MALELVICKHCGYKFRTDIEALINDGNTTVVKGFLNSGKPRPRTILSIDVLCPNCRKIFEYKVEP